MSLSLVIASSLVMGGCGSKTSDTDKKVETTTEVSKDSTDTKKENKKIVKNEEVANQEKTEVATATEETKTEEVKKDTKDSKADTKDNKTDNKSGNTGNSGSSNSGNSGNSGNHSGNGGSSNSGNSGNRSGNGGSGNTGNTGSTSHTPTPAPSNGGGNSSGGTSSTTPTHTHNWIPITQTIHHPAETRQEDQGHYETIVDQAAYDEEVPITEYCTYCKTCLRNRGELVIFKKSGLEGQQEVHDHIIWHSTIGEYSVQTASESIQVGTEKIHHDAITHQEWVSNIVTVTVKEAWDEVVTVGYQCSECGATK